MMTELERHPAVTPTLASIEAESFGALAEFGTKFILLVRESSLSDEDRKVVGERRKVLLDEINAQIKSNPTLDLRKHLESAYADLQRLVAELSKSQCEDVTDGR